VDEELHVVRVALVREATVRYPVKNPAGVEAIARRMLADRDRETFLVLCLDTRHRVNAAHVAAIGGIDFAPIEPRAVFTAALLAGAACVVLAHNHPSGDPTPSEEDLRITRRLVEAGRILGIPVIDHVIVGDGAHSMLEAGMMPESGGHTGRTKKATA
jgi:DNA repair protein RadC